MEKEPEQNRTWKRNFPHGFFVWFGCFILVLVFFTYLRFNHNNLKKILAIFVFCQSIYFSVWFLTRLTTSLLGITSFHSEALSLQYIFLFHSWPKEYFPIVSKRKFSNVERILWKRYGLFSQRKHEGHVSRAQGRNEPRIWQWPGQLWLGNGISSCHALAKERGLFAKLISLAPKILICKIATLSYYRVSFFTRTKVLISLLFSKLKCLVISVLPCSLEHGYSSFNRFYGCCPSKEFLLCLQTIPMAIFAISTIEKSLSTSVHAFCK